VIVLQSGGGPVAVAGTFLSFALFLSLTAHIAARNVLGDVPARKAFAVGPWPAAVAVVFTALSWPSAVAVALAVALDGLAVDRVYRPGRRLSLYVTFIHAVVSVLLGAVIVAGFLLLGTAPG
jgi:hypothetical protein